MLKEGFKHFPKKIVSSQSESFGQFTNLVIEKNVRLIHVQTSVIPDNGKRIISTIISGDGKIVFKKVHETVENTQPEAYDVVLSKKGILKRNLISEKYVEVIRKCLPGTDVVGPITNTLIKTEEKQKKKNADLNELFDYAKQKGIESYGINV